MSFDFPGQNDPGSNQDVPKADVHEEPVMASIADEAIPDRVTPPDQPPEVDVDEMLRLHPTSLVFDLISHGRSFLVPVLLGLFGAAQGDITLVILSGVAFIPAVGFSIFRYFTYRYCIKENHLIVRQGLIFRNVRTVPVVRIQNIDFVQNPLHRIMNVAEVKVETASGTKPEATLRVLSMAEMENLRSAVFGMQQAVHEAQSESAAAILNADSNVETDLHSSEPQVASAETYESIDFTRQSGVEVLSIPLSWLIKAGLASNRGLIMVGVLFGAYFQFANERPNFNFDWFTQFLPQDASTPFIVVASVVSAIVALILLRLLGIGWFVLRFYGYKLARHGNDLRIGCGLFTKVSATVPRQRIQFISVHEKLIMRWLGLASIRIETAGGAGSGGENATETVSKRWFVPVIPKEDVPRLLGEIRPGLEWNESDLDFKPLHEKATKRLCRLAIIQSIIIGLLGEIGSLTWGWVAGLVVAPLFIAWAFKKGKAMRYARTNKGVVYKSGVFTKKTSITFFEKIQTLSVNQSPFDRRWSMATLSVDTAAAGPADHRITVPYLDERFAKDEMQLLRVKTGQEQPVFG